MRTTGGINEGDVFDGAWPNSRGKKAGAGTVLSGPPRSCLGLDFEAVREPYSFLITTFSTPAYWIRSLTPAEYCRDTRPAAGLCVAVLAMILGLGIT
jgi:hypothetical protein